MSEMRYANNEQCPIIQEGDLAWYTSVVGEVKVKVKHRIFGDPYDLPLKNYVQVTVTDRSHYHYKPGDTITTKPIWLYRRNKNG